ncbi:hypothetical protein TPHA_0A02790 [Tetrapisispora phaffii CBS 4417]|uniref:Major facilitator superfamily (MFS) profile domain-containing protein n=1 Tax=Tetrapisispora phaffii (strain ATCC 24235 / CBS 4417 / NBRC 1672 / NRRL Y-8282 / UCD 70-5) TaxID=1071381 RepID=G8BN82_TETPH|nr:hypothetical protein TPHA_0A02790 [Tetrapisispora phaffii CBS 4417]CCE61360.1 hypothetical protein TPHA_0A02790 [Tetrapisispora phaffii CBS 4417]
MMSESFNDLSNNIPNSSTIHNDRDNEEIRNSGERNEVEPLLSNNTYYNQNPDMVIEQTGIGLYESIISDQNHEFETEETRWLRDFRLKHTHLPWHKKPSIYLLSFVVGLISLADIMIKAPIIPLQMDKICEAILEYNNDTKICDKSDVQEILSKVTSFSLLLSGIISLIFISKWNALSDKVGRVPIFKCIGIIKLLGLLLQIYSVAPRTKVTLWVFVIPNIIDAFSGGAFTIISTSNSYITDIMDPETVTVTISFMMSVLYGTIGLGPLLSSILVKFTSSNFYALFFSLFLNLLYILICFTSLVETRHPEAMKKSNLDHNKRYSEIWEQTEECISRPNNNFIIRITRELIGRLVSQIYVLLYPLKNLWAARDSNGSIKPRIILLTLLIIDALYVSSTICTIPTLVLFTTYKYNWTSIELGYFISITGLGRCVVLLLIAPFGLHYLKKNYQTKTIAADKIDLTCIRYPLFFAALSNVFMLFYADDIRSLIILVVCQCLSSLASPTLSGTMIKYCPSHKTGESFGAMSFVTSIIIFSISPIYLSIYGSSVTTRPEIFLVIPLTCGTLAFLLTFFLAYLMGQEESMTTETE